MYTPRIEQDEDNVMNFMDTIKIFHDPFSCKITDKIIHLASGIEASDEVQKSYMSAKEEGDKAYMEFNKSRPLSRLMEGEKNV